MEIDSNTEKWEHLSAFIEKRKFTGYSIRQLGGELGISYTNIARIERGKGMPRIHIRLILEHWLFPEKEQVRCPCVRCQNGVPSLLSRVVKLEKAVEEMEYHRLFDSSRMIGGIE